MGCQESEGVYEGVIGPSLFVVLKLFLVVGRCDRAIIICCIEVVSSCTKV